jgi:hypothetical protein
MNTPLGNMTIVLFGLEVDLWDSTDNLDRSSYTTVTICYLLFFLLSLFSSIFLVYLIAGSFLASLPIGFLVALIIASVVRFSLIILRRSIFDEKVETETKDPSMGTPSLIDLVTRIKSKFRSIQLKWPEGNSKVPALAGIVRLIIVTMMGLLVLFPLACLFHFSELQSINQEKRELYIKQFEKDGLRSQQSKTFLITKEIHTLEEELAKNASIYQAGGLAKDKKQAVARLRELFTKEVAEHQKNHYAQLARYRDEISSKYFLVLSFNAVARMPFFFLCLAVIAFLLFIPHLILLRLRSKAGLTYSQRSTEKYRKIIDLEYEKTSKEGYAYLEREWNYTSKDFIKDVYWGNPPYKTAPRKYFIDKKSINVDDFLTTFETNKLVEDKK